MEAQVTVAALAAYHLSSPPPWRRTFARFQRVHGHRLARPTCFEQPIRLRLTYSNLSLMLPSWMRPSLFAGD
jgi:hypothetical protein